MFSLESTTVILGTATTYASTPRINLYEGNSQHPSKVL